MSKLRKIFGFSPLVFAALGACSAGGGGGDSGLSGGQTGSGATGGIGAVGGGGTAATGGSASGASGGVGGTIVVSGASGASSGTGGSPMECAFVTATATELIPTVALVVDNSSSMFEGGSPAAMAWTLLYDALMAPSTGVVEPLQKKIQFGFASYKGKLGVSETDPACAIMTPDTTTFALDNYAAIRSVYASLGAETHAGDWETPTGFAVTTIAADLAAFTPAIPGPKYILLVTDGNPNTCKTPNPQCGQDASIAAVQAAYAQGIGTFVIGIGDIVKNGNSGCNADQSRCGEEHLQDIANAGAGLPVMAQPADYKYQPCVADYGGELKGVYAAAGEPTGTAPYFATNDSQALRTHLTELLNNVVSCTFDLDAIVTGDPTNSSVTLDGNPLTLGDTAGGWTLEDNHYQVTLQGSACDSYRALHSTVTVVFYCDEEGIPIAEPR